MAPHVAVSSTWLGGPSQFEVEVQSAVLRRTEIGQCIRSRSILGTCSSFSIRSTAGRTASGSWSLFHSFVVIHTCERMDGSSVASAAPISTWFPYRSAQSSFLYPSFTALRVRQCARY